MAATMVAVADVNDVAAERRRRCLLPFSLPRHVVFVSIWILEESRRARTVRGLIQRNHCARLCYVHSVIVGTKSND